MAKLSVASSVLTNVPGLRVLVAPRSALLACTSGDRWRDDTQHASTQVTGTHTRVVLFKNCYILRSHQDAVFLCVHGVEVLLVNTTHLPCVLWKLAVWNEFHCRARHRECVRPQNVGIWEQAALSSLGQLATCVQGTYQTVQTRHNEQEKTHAACRLLERYYPCGTDTAPLFKELVSRPLVILFVHSCFFFQ